MSKQLRQKSALIRLEQQLSCGVKPVKGSTSETIPLSDKDKNRINAEIAVLKQRVGKESKAQFKKNY